MLTVFCLCLYRCYNVSLLVSEPVVWIIGSSIVRDAYEWAVQRPDGPDLGLKQFGVSVFWDYQSGMRLNNVSDSVDYMSRHYPIPDIMILHCGGNDIGTVPSVVVTWQAKTIFENIKTKLKDTRIVWSQVLPRMFWRNVFPTYYAEKMRKRINSCLSSYFKKHKGCYVHYPDIYSEPKFFKADGVHLSYLGIDIMLNTLSGALYTFLQNPDANVYPVQQ